MDIERAIGSDEMGIIEAAHQRLLDSGKTHIKLEQFINDWINNDSIKDNNGRSKEENFTEWSESDEETPTIDSTKYESKKTNHVEK